MSRSTALRQTLQLSDDHSLEVLSIKASGDCFFDCIHALVSRTDEETCSVSGTLLFLHCQDETSSSIPSSQAMRDYVSDQMTSEQFDFYKMYAMAGVEEYSWMSAKSAPKDLQGLKDFARQSGKNCGPGKCLWADEFALRTISDGLQLTILIVDEQAGRAKGSPGAKRKRNCENDRADGRFVSIGNYHNAVILHRSRREHYNGVVIDNQGVFDIRQSPVAAIWPTFQSYNQQNTVKGGGTKQEETQDDVSNKKTPLDKSATTIRADHSTEQTQSIGKFFCGCAGFSNSNWVGNFYPKAIVGHNSDRQLSHYQEYFSTVELNSTFYGVPSESTVLKWKNLCSKNFLLAAKAPKGVTHDHDTLNPSTLTFFLSRMQPLKDVLVCILIQCPRTLVVVVSQLEQIKTALQQEASWYQGYFAFEFRNKTTFHDVNVRNFLAENKWTVVMHPDSLERATVGTSVAGRGASDIDEYIPEQLSQFAKKSLAVFSSGIVYVRLHGTNDEHRGEYNTNQLKEISEQVHYWRMQGLDVYCFFLNDLEPISISSPQKCGKEPWEKWAAMPKNARQLENLVFGLANEQRPDAPRKPKATLHNFFALKQK
jgi:uncharacterized protein YecE (DUF72 family)